MNFTPEQLQKAKLVKNVEELIVLARENGITLTEEEAAKYFAGLNKEGELADEELDNVAGGSSCINGRHYSDDPPHYLITTCGNWCDKFEPVDKDSWRGSACEVCVYHEGTVPMYCTVRTSDHDPYNDDIGNGFYR